MPNIITLHHYDVTTTYVWIGGQNDINVGQLFSDLLRNYIICSVGKPSVVFFVTLIKNKLTSRVPRCDTKTWQVDTDYKYTQPLDIIVLF